MEKLYLKIAFIIFCIGCSLIRNSFEKKTKQNHIVKDKKDRTEKTVLALTSLVMIIIPLLYIVSPWLNFANYNLPLPLHILGILLAPLTLWLFYRSHADLGRNWSVSLEVREKHELITNGVYKNIRHPMYSAIWLWCIIQALFLENYIAGLSGCIGFGLLYFFRVNREEKLMEEEFGEAYQDYKKRTYRLFPKL